MLGGGASWKKAQRGEQGGGGGEQCYTAGRALLALRHLFPPAQSLGLMPTREIKPYPEIKQRFSE